MLQEAIELVTKRRVRARGEVTGLELLDRGHERLGHETAAVGAKVAARVRIPPAEQGPFRYRHVIVLQMHAARSPEIALPCQSSSRRAILQHPTTHPRQTAARH